jgi:hypothetical protein
MRRIEFRRMHEEASCRGRGELLNRWSRVQIPAPAPAKTESESQQGSAILPAIVDLRGGGFELLAKPHGFEVRGTRALRWGITVLMLLGLAATIDWMVHVPTAVWTGLLTLAIVICGGLFCWFSLQPPMVKVTAEHVSVPDWPLRQRIPRSDLAYIFRGQAALGRYRAWQPAYFLVTRDGTPRVTIPAEDFTDDGLTELARRLQVPIQGDFTAQVR